MTKQELREAMPQCAEFIDDMREVFGEIVEIHAEENGHEVHWKKPE